MSVTAKAPNSEKGRRFFAQLDQALCNGSWAEVPELARKTEKHAPERGCFTLVARIEAQIASASHRPTSASSAGMSSIHGLSDAIPRLQEAVVSGKSAPEDAYVASACLAEIHWLQEDAGAALRVLPQQDVSTAASGGQTAALGWLEVCAAKVAFIRAAALDAQGQDAEVQDIYRAATTQAPGSRTPELRRWTERLLARACMSDHRRTLQPTLVTLTEALVSFRAWTSFWQRAPPPASGSGIVPTRIDIPRRQVWKAYYDLLSVILSHDLLYNSSTTARSDLLLVPQRAIPDQQYTDAKTRQRAELKRVETTYESLLLNETQFPKATQTNAEVELWVEQAVSNWTILSSADWTDQELGEGGKAALGRGMLDILYRAATKTFHSTAILRQLFTVHAALDEFDLAMYAFNSYAEIVGRGKARAEKTGKNELGSDDDDTAILTATEAVRVLCKYGDREQAEKAVEIGETIKQWLGRQRPAGADELETTEDNKTGEARPPKNPTVSHLRPGTMSAAHRATGISLAHWARVTYDTDARAGLQGDAQVSLQKARSYDENDVETAYALARVLAETQNVPAAIEVTKRAIAASNALHVDDDGEHDNYSRQRQLVPLWHLLALCLTTRDEHNAAVKMCDAAFDQFGDSTVLFGRQGMLDSTMRSRAQRGLVDSMDDFEKEGLLQIKMTQLTLIELMEGAERAADFSDEVLRLYARLFGNPEQLKGPSRPPPTATSMAPPPTRAGGGTLRSIAGSIRPKSGRNSAERDTSRQVSSSLAAPPGTSLGRQTATNGQAIGAPISITVTNEDGVSAEKAQREPHHHHLHLPFKMRGHHGDFRDAGSLRSKKSAEDLNEISDGARANHESPPPVPPKDLDATDHAQTATATDSSAVAPAVNHSMSPDVPTNPQQPLKAMEHNRPPGDWPAPLGHERNAPEQDVRLPAPHPTTSHGVASLPNTGSLQERQYRSSTLVKVWLFIGALYVRAGFFDDTGGAIEEALRLVEAFEADRSAQHANALALFQKGWGGGKSVDELWADVWSAKGDLAVARELPFEAMEQYEQALTYFPDHPEAIIGLSDILMDIYEEKMPAEEPEPPLITSNLPSTPAYRSHITNNNPATRKLATPPPRLTTSKSSLASAGRERPPNARTKDPTPAQLNRLAARDRAYMLLSTLTKLGTGWDSAEAWFALARAHELSGEVGRAKRALWWTVEVGEAKGVRGWGEVVGGGGGYTL
ncbi:hypothetical protein B0A55_09127 [Friedmanniomyces simplex]|uniref:Filamentation protein n=1 Tax=Friedmanniomyces simplex TaxID=329884 RepID=A0A4U0WYZ5_9PEZI|nr:hypothetical protein B0A55_09127 [Friedmanniomyces simplex]